MPIQDYNNLLNSNAAGLFDTRALYLPPNVEASQSSADAKKTKTGRNKLGIHMPKSISDIMSNACGRSMRKDHLEVCAYNTIEPMENIEHILQQLEIAPTKSYLTSSGTGIQVAKIEAPEAKKVVDAEKFKKSDLSRSLRKKSGFSLIRRWKRTKASYRALRWRNDTAREDKRELELWKKRMAARECAVQEEKGGAELCKRRILMGQKCRSGRLNYDGNGDFVPEDADSFM